jgi:hypothetical protein
VFIIYTKHIEGGTQHGLRPVTIRTKAGACVVALASKADAQMYMSQCSRGGNSSISSFKELMAENPRALAGYKKMLFFPSSDVLKKYLADQEKFPYERFIVDLVA